MNHLPYKRKDLIAEIVTFLLMLIFFIPFAIILLNSAKTSQQIINEPLGNPDNWLQFFINIYHVVTNRNVGYFPAFLNSVLITSLSLLTIGVFSAMAAWVLVRTKTKYSYLIFMFFLSGMVIPFQVVMLPLVRLLELMTLSTGIPFKDTIHAVVLAYIGFGAPLSIFLFHGFIKSIPIDIEEAAIIDGCSKPQLFFRIILPILKPIFVTLLVLNGMWIWNDYLLPVLIIGVNGKSRTLPLAVANLAGSYVREWDQILTSVVLAALPVIILFLFAQKHIIKGMTSGAIK